MWKGITGTCPWGCTWRSSRLCSSPGSALCRPPGTRPLPHDPCLCSQCHSPAWNSDLGTHLPSSPGHCAPCGASLGLGQCVGCLSLSGAACERASPLLASCDNTLTLCHACWRCHCRRAACTRPCAWSWHGWSCRPLSRGSWRSPASPSR